VFAHDAKNKVEMTVSAAKTALNDDLAFMASPMASSYDQGLASAFDAAFPNTRKGAHRDGNKAGRSLVIACGMIAREVQAIQAQLGVDAFDLTCLPAEFHHRPERIAPAMERAIIRAKGAGYTQILAGYGDCGTGGALDAVLARHNVKRIDGPHCFSFYVGNEAFAARHDTAMTHFFCTDFLARHFHTFMVEPLGLDRHPELRDMYFSHYTHFVYLAQTVDPVLEEAARNAAEFLGLEYAYQFTGFGDLSVALQNFAAAKTI
jgi:hypothetical protein